MLRNSSAFTQRSWEDNPTRWCCTDVFNHLIESPFGFVKRRFYWLGKKWVSTNVGCVLSFTEQSFKSNSTQVGNVKVVDTQNKRPLGRLKLLL